MKKMLFILITALLVLTNAAQAQNLTFDNVAKVYLRSSGSISTGREITGYYFFYKLENADKKNARFKLVITDANLNKVAEKEIVDLKSTYITDAAYSGDFLAIKFLSGDRKDMTQTIRLFDNQSNEVSKVASPFDYKASMIMAMNMGNDDDEIESTDLHPIPTMGFLNFTPIITKGGSGMFSSFARPGIEITMIPQKGSTAKTWKYQTPDKKIEAPFYLGANKEVAFVNILKKDKYSDKTFDYNIVGFDIKTGKKLFDKQFQDSKYNLTPVSYVYIPETNENIFFGILLEKDVKATKSESLGMFISKIDNTGNVISTITIPWDVYAKQFKPVDEKGKPMDIEDVYIHKIVPTKDGKYLAIGERFTKSASALGIASMILGGGNTSSSVVKLVVRELVIMEFDKSFKPLSVKFYDKGKRNVELPAGAGMLGSSILGMFVKGTGQFGYEFLQQNSDNSVVTVGYSFREDKTNYFGALTYTDGVVTQDKISLKTDATKLNVYAGKSGYIMINEYFKKEKRMDSRLEKINY